MYKQAHSALTQRYKENYGIPSDAVITYDIIMNHWELEQALTHELVNSTADERWDVYCTSIFKQLLALPGIHRADCWNVQVPVPAQANRPGGALAAVLVKHLPRSAKIDLLLLSKQISSFK